MDRADYNVELFEAPCNRRQLAVETNVDLRTLQYDQTLMVVPGVLNLAVSLQDQRKTTAPGATRRPEVVGNGNGIEAALLCEGCNLSNPHCAV